MAYLLGGWKWSGGLVKAFYLLVCFQKRLRESLWFSYFKPQEGNFTTRRASLTGFCTSVLRKHPRQPLFTSFSLPFALEGARSLLCQKQSCFCVFSWGKTLLQPNRGSSQQVLPWEGFHGPLCAEEESPMSADDTRQLFCWQVPGGDSCSGERLFWVVTASKGISFYLPTIRVICPLLEAPRRSNEQVQQMAVQPSDSGWLGLEMAAASLYWEAAGIGRLQALWSDELRKPPHPPLVMVKLGLLQERHSFPTWFVLRLVLYPGAKLVAKNNWK